jgi:DNA (cytosine-5)-methyltransferase 1
MGMKFIDMFSGIGTVRMGFEQAGHECVYSIEWDKHKRGIYNVIFGEEPQGRDIRAVRANELPRADIWTFGAPCQDFSMAGKREGLEGDRSSLIREVFRLVRETKEEHRPQWLLYENVKGMLSSNKGFDYLEILFEMDALGYDIEWQLLNSKDFGVPQNRERVFTLGHLRGTSTRKVFPITTNCQSSDIEVIGNCGNTGHHGCDVYSANGISPTVKERDYKDPIKILIRENTIKGYIEGYPGDGIRLDHPDGKTGRGRIQKQTSPTLTTSCGVGVIMDDCKIRKLTSKEYWRLQGVPDYTIDKVIAAGISDTQMYRGAGDACTVNVIYEIAKRL